MSNTIMSPTQLHFQLAAFEEYLLHTDSNLAATVTLVATGVQPQPLNSVEPHSRSACAWERDHVALQMNNDIITIVL